MEHKFRDFIQLNPDPRKRFNLDLSKELDQKILEDAQRSVKELSKKCFKNCVSQGSWSSKLSKSETSCVEKCIDSNLGQFKQLYMHYTDTKSGDLSKIQSKNNEKIES